MKNLSIILFILITAFTAFCQVEMTDSLFTEIVKSNMKMPKEFSITGGIHVESCGLSAMIGITDSFPSFGSPVRKVNYISKPGCDTFKGDSAKAYAEKVGVWEMISLSQLNENFEKADWEKVISSVNKKLSKENGQKYYKGKLTFPEECGFDFKCDVYLEEAAPHNIYKIRFKNTETSITWNMKEMNGINFPEKIEFFLKNTVMGIEYITKFDILYFTQK